MMKYFLIMISIMNLSLVAMEDSGNNNNNNHKQWVVAANKVHVKSLKLHSTFDIDDKTTIQNIKDSLFDREGIPAEQQRLFAAYRSGWTLWWTEYYSSSLANHQNVKDVMNEYNTDVLRLWLGLRNNPGN